MRRGSEAKNQAFETGAAGVYLAGIYLIERLRKEARGASRLRYRCAPQQTAAAQPSCTPDPVEIEEIYNKVAMVQGNLGGSGPTSEATETTNDRLDILGVRVSAINLKQAIESVELWIRGGKCTYICVTGVHGLMESRRDPQLRDIHNRAGLVTPDGMPLVWLSRLLGKSHTERVCGRDLMRKLTAVSSLHGYRQYYYGGSEGVVERLTQALTRAHPGLDVAGTRCPPFRQLTREEDDDDVNAINIARPDILWIGLSTPKQERWMATHLGRINAPVMIGVGAAFDFLAGTKREAPVWMQRVGLEWLFRLLSEPRRLWRRYAYIVPGFAFLAAGEFARQIISSRIGHPR
jgi:N-acetylglucosaminyldiphosphoundecaprenol N-acetyl-beta-D-mannosaminyltransferase